VVKGGGEAQGRWRLRLGGRHSEGGKGLRVVGGMVKGNRARGR